MLPPQQSLPDPPLLPRERASKFASWPADYVIPFNEILFSILVYVVQVRYVVLNDKIE